MYDTAEAVVFTRTKKRVPCRVTRLIASATLMAISYDHHDSHFRVSMSYVTTA
ncbi:hypothetical protein TIFTF001_005545 [Ficus carica]|uniref:Uncharacterized protein n=1 Tax=Ficus carica TaxID=3494 RepID=A0AA87ZGE7_FICCA|nr:hypothetical protein TIFTF001_005545 [Ficus carica]